MDRRDVGVYVAAWSMHGPGRVLERSVGVRMRRGISDALYAKPTRVPLAWHDRHHSGDVQHRVDQASHRVERMEVVRGRSADASRE